MSMWGSQGFGRPHPLDDFAVGTRDSAVIRFFNAVYAWMAVGLAVTAGVAWAVSTHYALLKQVNSPGALIGIFVAEIILVIVISSAIRRLNAAAATALFVLYAALNGLLLSSIFLFYTLTSITGAFGACAAMFAVMSLYGMFTKTDLTRLGKILFMALIGLIIATVINIFVANSAFYWIVSYAGVIIFAGLTAYDTQRLQTMAVQTQGDPALAARLSVNGALVLYLDFINMFLFLLRIMGNRRQ
ncbi:MAG TPA: Bax inhibitor-1/YccA family protein [Tepidisphaeraceae bacterium]|nr:Bax inhibitor-1/YccA family protein [Tepidisphaeraceae bacterium]